MLLIDYYLNIVFDLLNNLSIDNLYETRILYSFFFGNGSNVILFILI
jgi:hypothetical protein